MSLFAHPHVVLIFFLGIQKRICRKWQNIYAFL